MSFTEKLETYDLSLRRSGLILDKYVRTKFRLEFVGYASLIIDAKMLI